MKPKSKVSVVQFDVFPTYFTIRNWNLRHLLCQYAFLKWPV